MSDYGICGYCANWRDGLISNDRYSGCCAECRDELHASDNERENQ